MNALRESAIATTMACALAGCGGGGGDPASPSPVANTATVADTAVDNSTISASANHDIVPRGAKVGGKTLEQWTSTVWQDILQTSIGPFWPNPVNGCNGGINVRPITLDTLQSNLLYWQTPILPLAAGVSQNICDESANVVPAGTYIFLGTLDTVSTSLGLPFSATTAKAQKANAERWADRVQDLSITIDNKPVTNIKSYHVATDQFTFTVGGPFATLFTPPETNPKPITGTAEANGYYLILKPLPAGAHTIHVTGMYDYHAGDPGVAGLETNIDMTLLITVGP